MEKDMKDIIKRDTPQNNLLYEEIEPLFKDAPKRDIKRIVRSAAFSVALLAACIACVWGVISISSAFGAGDGSGNAGIPGGISTDETEENGTSNEINETSNETEQTEWSDSGSSDTAESPTVETQSGNETYTSDTERQTDETETKDMTVDISENERGDRYIVNYTSKDIDVGGLIDRGFVYSEQKNSQAPLVMIIHTHTSEQYSGDEGKYYGLGGVVGVGDKINTILNARGLSAIHCTVIHDGGAQNAYLAARETIKTMLEIYPTIKYIIDVHALNLTDDKGDIQSTLVTADGAAQMRLTVGTDVKREGEWQDDLSLALALRGELNKDQAKACAPVTVSHGGYNGDLCRFYIMLDVGAVGNSTREAIRAGEKFAKALAQIVLSE